MEASDDYSKGLVGTGPYVLAEMDSEGNCTLTRNDNYFISSFKVHFHSSKLYNTSLAREIILLNPNSRNSRATGPKTRVPTGALSALTILGFSKAAIEKALDRLLKQMPDATVEMLIKEALKVL